MVNKDWCHLVERLRCMKRSEIFGRSRQGLGKRADTLLSHLKYDFARGSQSSSAGIPSRFFFSCPSVDSILALIKERIPGRTEEIIREAEQICQGRFDLLGYSGLKYHATPGTIDWHLDAVHGKRCARKPFYRIRYLDYDKCGDSKVIWELNRHQHFVTLAKAYRLTHEQRYIDEIFRQKHHWISENPYAVGINWASSLEVAFRSISWLWTYYILAAAPGVPDFRLEWLHHLALHGRHIERYRSTYFSPNTHLLGEAVALFFLGALCPELTDAGRWKELGWKLILQEAERQILPDGVHFEQSTYYHVYALDLFLHAQILAAVNNIPVPPSFLDKIEKMLTALCMLSRNGPPPRFGDDDGGRLFDPHRNHDEHLRDPLTTGAILFQRGDFNAVAAGLHEETLWLLGEEGVRQWDRLPATPVASLSRALPCAGYYMLANRDTQLFVNAAPRPAQTSGHAHADALSICLQSHGASLLIDPGTMEYVGQGGDRALYRGTAMHNTVQVDGLDQAETCGPFSWKGLTGSEVDRWVCGHGFDFLIATHKACQRPEFSVTHRRCVVSLNDGVFLVRDVIEGSGTHQLDIRWHLGQDLESLGERVFRVRGGEHGLALLPANRDGWTETVLEQSWSPAYGGKAPMTVMKFSAATELPAEFSVLLRVLEDVRGGQQSFRRIERCQPGLAAYCSTVDERDYSFFFYDQGGPWRSSPLSSDAEFLCRELSPDASERLIVCGGTCASVDGGSVLRCSGRVEWVELVSHGRSTKISSSDLSAVIEQPVSATFVGPVPALSTHC
jgi:hypothetical protein